MPQTTVGPLADQDLLGIFNQVCDAYLPSSPAVIDPEPPGTAGPGSAVVATVSITGAWDGYIRLRCPVDTAADVAAGMLDLDPGDIAAGDVDDAMGELINILAGNIKCLLPQPAQLGLPIVGVGPEDTIRYPTAQQTHHVALRWNDQPVDLSLLAAMEH